MEGLVHQTADLPLEENHSAMFAAGNKIVHSNILHTLLLVKVKL